VFLTNQEASIKEASKKEQSQQNGGFLKPSTPKNITFKKRNGATL